MRITEGYVPADTISNQNCIIFGSRETRIVKTFMKLEKDSITDIYS